MKTQNNYDVGIYCRLSRDDKNTNLESMSIANQRHMLTDYVKEKGWNLREIYIDDGFSGTNFERPEFKRMIQDIESGRIDCVITKDLSRLGRNYAKVGYYTEEYFLEQGVRFIAINDSFDSLKEEENDIAPFKNVLNEWYPRDISKKVRQVKKVNAMQGKFMGSQAPYGYKKSPEDKHILIIDEPAAAIMRRIFAEFVAGDSIRMIGERLNQEGIDSPRFYHSRYPGGQTPKPTEKNNWGNASITQMLRNQAYIGNMVQGKRQVTSFKTKKRRCVDPDNWIIVENTHEPIISREIWNATQKRLDRGGHRIKRSRKEGVIGLFSGCVICADCGSRLAYAIKYLKDGSSYGAYRCSRYNNAGKTACSQHYIQEAALVNFVLSDIRMHARLASSDRERISRQLALGMCRNQDGGMRQLEAQQKEIDDRQAVIASTVKSLYEDKCTGKLSESVFQDLLANYTNEQAALTERQTDLWKKAAEKREAQNSVDEWLALIAEHMDIKELDRTTVMGLIDTITIGEARKENGKRTQEITIQYRFIGNLLEDIKEDIA